MTNTMNNIDIKVKLVESGKSKVFAKWQELGLITKEEFIENLKWVCEDPLDEKGRLTREIALEISNDMQEKIFSDMSGGKFGGKYDPENLKGKIVRLRRATIKLTPVSKNVKATESVVFIKVDDRIGRIVRFANSLSAIDRI